VNGNNQWEWEGNGNTTKLNLGLGMGMGMDHWEWEGMGLKKRYSRSSLVFSSGNRVFWCILFLSENEQQLVSCNGEKCCQQANSWLCLEALSVTKLT